jgi:hypothetical protein
VWGDVVWYGEICGYVDVAGSERELRRQSRGKTKAKGRWDLGGTAFLWLNFGFHHWINVIA